MSERNLDDVDWAPSAEQSSEDDEAQEGNWLAAEVASSEPAEQAALHIEGDGDDDEDLSDLDDIDIDDPEADAIVNDALNLDEAAETEAAAEVLNDANARDITYQEKIAELEKLCSQPPEETARFYADQAAVYELINAEVAELAVSLEREKTQAEQLKTWSAQRQQSLLDRRQKLLKHLGGSPGDMTRRTVREQPSEPQIARLRADLENMRVTYQREMRLAETKERELQDKVRLLETEGARLLSQIVAGEKRSQQIEELEEQTRKREHELAVERKNRDE